MLVAVPLLPGAAVAPAPLALGAARLCGCFVPPARGAVPLAAGARGEEIWLPAMVDSAAVSGARCLPPQHRRAAMTEIIISHAGR